MKKEIMLSRRQLLKGAAVLGLGLAMPMRLPKAFAFSQSPAMQKFLYPLPGLGPAGIPLATKNTMKFQGISTDVYNLEAAEYQQQIPGLANPTTFMGYADLNGSHRYLGGIVVATRGKPILFNMTNKLQDHQIIPIDGTLMASETKMVMDLPLNRMAVHLHGGLTPWISDGTPFQWFDPTGLVGSSFMNVPGTNPGKGVATYYYPNNQSARFVWYHDHAMGITRTNAYCGIASGYVITDDFEAFLVKNGFLPDPVGILLILQEKVFFDHANDPNYPITSAVKGSLWYPREYEVNSLANGKGRWDYGPDQDPPGAVSGALPAISAVPEFFCDTAMVNGQPYPTLTVPRGTVRFRMLNGNQARFWHLNLYREAATLGEADTSKPGPAMYQVGTEGGFLPLVAKHPNGIKCPLDLATDPSGNTANPNGPFNLLLAPAERADLLIDFSGLAVGTSFILYNDAPAPFPGGDPRNDHYTGDPDFTNPNNNVYALSGGSPSTQPGQGPNTRTIMKIVVGSASGPKLPNMILFDLALLGNFTVGVPGVSPQQDFLPAIFNLKTGRFDVPHGVPIFNKTLNEDFDELGRLIQMGGNDVISGNNSQGLPTFSRAYVDAPTETPSAGAVQIWDFYNNTMDTHPWHFHLVNVQVVGRGIFDTKIIHANGDDVALPVFGSFTDLKGNRGVLTPPDPNEYGWKETVRMNPGQVTRVIMQFKLPQLPFNQPSSPRFKKQFPGKKVHEYVHHCHILEHEEHDMMRPLVVIE